MNPRQGHYSRQGGSPLQPPSVAYHSIVHHILLIVEYFIRQRTRPSLRSYCGSIMQLGYRLSKVCGSVFTNGNLLFTPDGNSLISCIGNRISIFDLIHHSTSTLPFENRENIHAIAISHNGTFLISADIHGHALIINIKRKVVILRINFKCHNISAIQFTADDRYFALTHHHGVQIWKTPSTSIEFAPLSLIREYSGCSDTTTCLDWSRDSSMLIVGSKDLSARLYDGVLSKEMKLTVLSGHRSPLVGVHLANDLETAYTIAHDGALFTWINVADEGRFIRFLYQCRTSHVSCGLLSCCAGGRFTTTSS